MHQNVSCVPPEELKCPSILMFGVSFIYAYGHPLKTRCWLCFEIYINGFTLSIPFCLLQFLPLGYLQDLPKLLNRDTVHYCWLPRGIPSFFTRHPPPKGHLAGSDPDHNSHLLARVSCAPARNSAKLYTRSVWGAAMGRQTLRTKVSGSLWAWLTLSTNRTWRLFPTSPLVFDRIPIS